MVVAYRNGAPVMLTDVAQMMDGVENNKLAAWMNKTPAVIVNVQRQPGANTISVVKRIKALMPQLQSNLPTGIEVTTLTDLTTPIQASVSDVEFELMLTVGLVVMVMFLFLRSLYATIIPSVAVPLSLVGTFAAMYALGFSLDNLSLMALTISTGFVVDDAIVMVENISRYLEEGESPMQAALKGAEQIGFTILSLTVSLIAVLIPLLFMGDVVGRLFREFAVTLAVTIIVSAVVSLTLTPMMASRILRHDPEEQQSRFYRASEHVFKSMIDFYGRTLRVVLRYQTITLLVALGTLVLTVFLYIIIPKGFFPVQDTGIIQGISQASPTIGYKAMAEKQQELANVILQDPAVESLSSFIGADGTNITGNSGRMSINLKPLDQRKLNASDVIRRLQSKLQNVQGIQLFMQPVQNITVDDRVSRTQYQYTLEDPDLNELAEWTNRFVDKLKQLPELEDVATDQQPGGLAVALDIDRPTASRLGIAPTTIDNTLYDAFGQRQINTMYTQLNQYHVILEAQPQFQVDPDKLNKLYIRSNSASGTTGAAASSTSNGSTSAGSNALTTTPLYTPSAQTLGPPATVLTPGTSTSTSSKGASSAGPTSSQPSSAVPLGAFTPFRHADGATVHRPSGPVPGHHRVFQSGAQRRPWRRNHGSHKGAEGLAHAEERAGGFPGNRGLVSKFTFQHAALDSCGARDRLHCAGRALRKFHSPRHDSFHSALGGRWRIPGADSVQAGPQRRGHHRHRAADRYRQEKRHHDGGLRVGGGAPAREESDGCDLRSVPAAFSSHHDDHHGRVAWRITFGSRYWLWFRVAPTAGHRHGGRAVSQPGAHPLHHSGHLHLFRQFGASVRAWRTAPSR